MEALVHAGYMVLAPITPTRGGERTRNTATHGVQKSRFKNENSGAMRHTAVDETILKLS